MRKLLQIGEVAQLLGVTTKTIRHYQKVGLLQEPERTAAGYRLYSSQDLLWVKRIRHLQSLGLSLKHIKTILGEPMQQHTLHEILQSLDAELATQVRVLEERRARIQALLSEGTLTTLDRPDPPPSFTMIKELLGERISTLGPEVLEIEEKLWASIDDFHWPAEYRERVLAMAQSLAAQPQWLEHLLPFSAMMTQLAALPEDAPEVEALVEASLQNADFQAFLQNADVLSELVPHMTSPFADVLSDLLFTNFTPAQRRFFAEIMRRQSLSSS